MHHPDVDSCFSPVIADLIANGCPVAPERAWSVVSGGARFDGGTLPIDDANHARDVLDAISTTEDHGCFVIWTPIEKRQRGRIPRALRCGYTLAANGNDDVTIFQSIVFPALDVVDIIARLPSGQVVLVRSERVSAWDGTSADADWPVRATS